MKARDPGRPGPMRVLIDVKHPAHVHFFRHLIRLLGAGGDRVLVTSREKEMTTTLLDRFGIPHLPISAIGGSKPDLVRELLVRDLRCLRVALGFRPHVLLGLMGVTVAPVGRLIGRPSLVFYDTENARLSNRVSYALCTRFVTPRCYRERLGARNLRYPGYHELAYLHPNRFRPDPTVLERVGLAPGARFTVVRFVSWGASHDVGHRGLADETKVRAVAEFSRYGKVFVTSEKELPRELEPHRLRLPPEEIHALLSFATLLYGESATMASEAAVLGTHAIYLDDEGRGYTDEQERLFGLVANFSESRRDQERSVERGLAWLRDPGSKAAARRKRRRLLAGTIDVTRWIYELVRRFAPSAARGPAPTCSGAPPRAS